jgi:TPR repeat protein
MQVPTRRPFRIAWVVLAIGGCTQANVATSPSNVANQQAEDQQLLAATQACAQRVRQVALATNNPETVRAAMADCQRQLRPLAAKVNGQAMARLPGLYGETMRASFAIQSAEQAGDEPQTFQLSRAMDAEAEKIKARAQNDPAHARDLLQALGDAQTKVGVGYEKRGNDAEAAVYYQRAIDTLASINGMDMGARTHLGFLYANGRGVRREKEKALALFGGANGEVLGARGPTETSFAYLLAHGKLPYRQEDITPSFYRSAEDEIRRQAERQASDHEPLTIPRPPANSTNVSPFYCRNPGEALMWGYAGCEPFLNRAH